MAEDVDGGECVNRISNLGQFAKDSFWITVEKQGPVAAPPDTLDQSFDIGLKPDGRCIVEDQRPCFGLHERAATGRYHLSRTVDKPRDHASFAIAKMILAEALENLGHRQPCCGFDF